MCINYATTTLAVFHADFVWDIFPKHENRTAISPRLKADSSSLSPTAAVSLTLKSSTQLCSFSLSLSLFFQFGLANVCRPPAATEKAEEGKMQRVQARRRDQWSRERKGKASVFMRGGCRLRRLLMKILTLQAFWRNEHWPSQALGEGGGVV